MCSTYKQLCLGVVLFYLIKIGGGGGGSFNLEIPRGGGLKKEPSIREWIFFLE